MVSHWARNIVFAPKLVEAVKEVLAHYNPYVILIGCVRVAHCSFTIQKNHQRCVHVVFLFKVLETKDLLCWDCDVNVKPPSSQVDISYLVTSSTSSSQAIIFSCVNNILM